MILYHGSNQLITRIDLSKSKDFKDFGRGSYLTKDYTRAVAMAQRPLLLLEKAVRKCHRSYSIHQDAPPMLE